MCTFALVMKRILVATFIICSFFAITAQNSENSQTLSSGNKDAITEDKAEKTSYAWTVIEPLGLRQQSTIDTLLYNYYHKMRANKHTKNTIKNTHKIQRKIKRNY